MSKVTLRVWRVEMHRYNQGLCHTFIGLYSTRKAAVEYSTTYGYGCSSLNNIIPDMVDINLQDHCASVHFKHKGESYCWFTINETAVFEE